MWILSPNFCVHLATSLATSFAFGREVVNTQRLMSSSMDGLIVSLSNETNNVDHFKRLMQREIPIVFFDRTHVDLNASNVVLDNIFGGEQEVCGFPKM
jgi:DNA-binding LacI/PurR family transcriptional regulator